MFAIVLQKQTEESVDSMFSRYQQSHSRGSMGNADTDNDLANAGGPRGAAMVNKMRQSNRGMYCQSIEKLRIDHEL